jgi:hypothetical protein
VSAGRIRRPPAVRDHHPLPPRYFGTDTADGGMALNPDEAEWLREVLGRILVAEAIDRVSNRARSDAPYMEVTRRRAEAGVLRKAGEVADLYEPAPSDDDVRNDCFRLIACATVIRGGLPPVPYHPGYEAEAERLAAMQAAERGVTTAAILATFGPSASPTGEST